MALYKFAYKFDFITDQNYLKKMSIDHKNQSIISI